MRKSFSFSAQTGEWFDWIWICRREWKGVHDVLCVFDHCDSWWVLVWNPCLYLVVCPSELGVSFVMCIESSSSSSYDYTTLWTRLTHIIELTYQASERVNEWMFAPAYTHIYIESIWPQQHHGDGSAHGPSHTQSVVVVVKEQNLTFSIIISLYCLTCGSHFVWYSIAPFDCGFKQFALSLSLK